MTVYTVDISHHDWDRAKGEIRWPEVARYGIVAACVRMTYGDPGGASWPSRHGREMARGAVAAGLITGGYHNLVRGDMASTRRQVDWLRAEMDAAGATWAMVDVERYEELLARGLQPQISDVRAWCARWRQVDDRPLLVYLPQWVWGHLGNPSLAGLGCPLVASDYGPNTSGGPASLYAARGGDSGRGWQSYGGAEPMLWQFGSNGRVPGLAAPTDVNAFRGSLAELRTILTQENDMPLTDTDAVLVAQAVHNQQLGRSSTTIGQGIQGAARAEQVAELTALMRAALGQPAEEVLAEIRAQGEQTRAALVQAVSEQAPVLAAAVADRLGTEVTAAEVGEALAAELAGMLAAGAGQG